MLAPEPSGEPGHVKVLGLLLASHPPVHGGAVGACKVPDALLRQSRVFLNVAEQCGKPTAVVHARTLTHGAVIEHLRARCAACATGRSLNLAARFVLRSRHSVA